MSASRNWWCLWVGKIVLSLFPISPQFVTTYPLHQLGIWAHPSHNHVSSFVVKHISCEICVMVSWFVFARTEISPSWKRLPWYGRLFLKKSRQTRPHNMVSTKTGTRLVAINRESLKTYVSLVCIKVNSVSVLSDIVTLWQWPWALIHLHWICNCRQGVSYWIVTFLIHGSVSPYLSSRYVRVLVEHLLGSLSFSIHLFTCYNSKSQTHFH